MIEEVRHEGRRSDERRKKAEGGKRQKGGGRGDGVRHT